MWWGLSLDSWNNLIVAFGVLSGAFVLLTGGVTYIAFQLQKQEAIDASIALERYKLAVASKVADAENKGIEAGKAAGGALLKAAEANERAAKAELELAKYRAGRSITAEQHRMLVQWLTMSPKGRVVVKPNFLNSEATRLANQISSAFNESGFSEVGDAPLKIVSSNRPGLFLVVLDAQVPPSDTEPILRAFSEAGIPIESGHGDWVPDRNTVVILVGDRP
jgi:hypothetical protein